MGINILGSLCQAAEHKKTAGGGVWIYNIKNQELIKKIGRKKTVKLDKHTKLMHLCTSRLT